jgi:hypothetical protein
MEEAIQALSKRFIYFDYFHKVPWLWGGRKTVSPSHSSVIRKYPGFSIMIAVGLWYTGSIWSILLGLILKSEKDPDNMDIVGAFLLLVIGLFATFIACFGIMMLLHSDLLGHIFMQLRTRKGKYIGIFG